MVNLIEPASSSYLESHCDIDWVLVVDVNGDLPFIDILRVMVDHNAINLPKLPAELLRAQDLLIGKLSRNANYVE